jgi:hypothetical protein
MAVLEEENPHVYCERWFRRTGTEPRKSEPVGKEHQKGAKKLPEVGKNPQKEAV